MVSVEITYRSYIPRHANFVVIMGYITRFEVARLISARALQLSLGAPPLAKVENSRTMQELAKKEFEEKALPLTILREFPDGRTEKTEVF
jgi:DNA-directed RNA polymerase subunit K/omega